MALPDIDGYPTLGGELNEARAVTDPTTDLPKAADCTTRADVAAMTRTISRGFCAFSWSGSAITLVEFEAVWAASAGYGPTVTRTGTGTFNVELPTTVPDARAVGGTCNINVRRPFHTSIERAATTIGRVEAKRAGPTSITVTTLNTSLAATDPNAGDVIIVSWH